MWCNAARLSCVLQLRNFFVLVAITVDESYMLPVLARFNGSPEVDDAGQIVYVFPDLQQTATVSALTLPSLARALPMAAELGYIGASDF